MMTATIEGLALAVRKLERIRTAIRSEDCRDWDEDTMPCWMAPESDLCGNEICGPCQRRIAERDIIRPKLYAARRRLRAALDRELRMTKDPDPDVSSPLRRERVWLYHCGFCQKSNCSAASMTRHQQRCTVNPDRECGMCDESGTGHGGPVSDAVEVLGTGTKFELDALREFCEGCPACMLAAIRQSKIEDVPSDPLEFDGGVLRAGTAYSPWSYSEEKKAFWEQVNETRNEGIGY